MLTIHQAEVSFGAVRAVDQVNLTVPDGEVLVLLGPSGCGKSTLLRAVAGVEPLTSGQIRWDGTDLANVPVHRRGFGLMFQDGVLFPHRTVAGNVGYGLARNRWEPGAKRARIAELLQLVDMTGYADRPVGTLSGGQAQRVALARALAPEPRLLLLDEPFSALGRVLRERLLEDLRRILKVTGATAIFVTHDHEEAFTLADQVAVMQDGTIVQTGPPQQVWAEPADDRVALSVGYTRVVDGPSWRSAGGPDLPGLGDGSRLALRPAALAADGPGSLSGRCAASWRVPDGVRLSVDVPGLGIVPAVAAPTTDIHVGEQVRLRFVPAAAAVISSTADGQPDLIAMWQGVPS